MIMFLAIYILLAVVAIISKSVGSRVYSLAKLLPIGWLSVPLLAFCLLLVWEGDTVSLSKWLLCGGLFFGLCGDYCLLKEERFLYGLVAFCLGHFCYIFAFMTFEMSLSPVPLVAIVLMGAVAVAFILPRQGKLLWPARAYLVVISTMAALAWSVFAAMPDESSSLLAALGASSFVVSDLMLSIRKFKSSFFGDHTFVLMSYYLAQILIFLGLGWM